MAKLTSRNIIEHILQRSGGYNSQILEKYDTGTNSPQNATCPT